MSRKQRRRLEMVERLRRKSSRRVEGGSSLHKEYRQVQADLAAYLNPPRGVQLGKNFWMTLNYLEGRLDQLEQQLNQQAA